MNRLHPGLRRELVWVLIVCLLFALALLSVSRQPVSQEVASPDAVVMESAHVWSAGASYPQRTPDGDGLQLSLPDNWDSRRPSYSGYLWYRIDLPPQVTQWQRPTVYLPAAGMNAELWLDGQRVAGLGRMEPEPSRHFYTPQLLEIPPALLQSRGAASPLYVLLNGHPGYRCGLAPVWIGEHEALYSAWRWRRFWQIEGNAATIVINIGIAVFVLLLGRRDPAASTYRWFAATTVVWALRNLNYWVVHPVIPDLLFAKLCVSGAAWFVAFFAIFAMRFAQTHQSGYRGPRWLQTGALSYAAVATLYFLAAPDYSQAYGGFAALAAIGVMLTIWSMVRLMRLAFAAPSRHLLAVAGGAMVYLILLLNDYAIGVNHSSLGEIFVRQYAALPLFVAVTATLSKRYGDALSHARELAGSLQSQVEAQRAALERSFERLREVEREQARTQERARVMGDLHDGLGLHLATALRHVHTQELARDVLAGTLQDCMDELRVAVDSLDEDERDPLSLLGSLRYRMASRFEALGVRLDWQVAADLPELAPLDPSQALHLLRMVQEALGNALKHSRATVVTLSLGVDAAGTHIRISDNGSGFDPASVRAGRGLSNLQRRAQQLGAVMAWSDEGPGTCLSIRLPLPPKPEPTP